MYFNKILLDVICNKQKHLNNGLILINKNGISDL